MAVSLVVVAKFCTRHITFHKVWLVVERIIRLRCTNTYTDTLIPDIKIPFKIALYRAYNDMYAAILSEWLVLQYI